MTIIDRVTMISLLLAGVALIREREHGTIEHLLVMPVTPFQIMMSKIWSMGLLVLIGTAFALVVIVQGLLHVPILGSRALFLLGGALNLASMTSLGILLATLTRSMAQFCLLLVIVLLPLQMLSGGSTPRESMPQIVQTIMLASPTTHYVAASQAILYRGAGLGIVWPQFAAMIVIGGVFFWIAHARFRTALAQMA
jgi:ABC-2 type transport system permease protein